MALLGCFLVPVDDAPAAGQVAGGPSGASRPVGLFTPGQRAGTRFSRRAHTYPARLRRPSL